MRVVATIAALLTLAACDPGVADTGASSTTNDAKTIASAGMPESAFDYRYAFRLPSARIAGVQESHAKGCEQLGPARCKIVVMRYNVDDSNQITAILTLKVDPELARAFGKAAVKTVNSAGGALTKAEIAGVDSLAANGRGDTVMARLRDAAGNTAAQLRGTPAPDQRVTLTAKAARLRAAMATIAEVDQDAATSLATTPLLFTYTSGGSIAALGGSSDASFSVAGDTFISSVSGLAVILAGIGPWILLLGAAAFVLRKIVQSVEEPMPAPQLPAAPRSEAENRNVIQRWFHRDEAKEHEHAE